MAALQYSLPCLITSLIQIGDNLTFHFAETMDGYALYEIVEVVIMIEQ